MEYARSVRSALSPQTLFVSAFPILISVSLLHRSHNISFLQLDVVAILVCAMLSQLLSNLNAVYSNFQRTLQPIKSETKDVKIVLNLLSLTQIRRWSFLFYGLQLTLLGLTHVVCAKSIEATRCLVVLATLALIYCRLGDEALLVGAKEAVTAWTIGPVLMIGTSFYLVAEVPWAIVLYAYIVMLYTWAFSFLDSARDAPFARRIGRSETSLALRLGFQWTFQCFLLLVVSFYGVVLVAGIVMGHLGNILLVATVVKVKTISEDFRLERLNHLPGQFAKLGLVLGFGFITSILTGLS
ncbi:hypothetical protein CCR75_005394 [Bremia lactucae]|uniref:Uncharacterized protein n=1 Tax=Bremia lactucae TaxID=4779 RepID=A0A976IEE8_BRELC|nr:hypothetical protein CCR75_005394 [Bremia lactucae]